MTTDWRDEPASVVTPLIARECGVWDTTLGWDVAAAWSVLEPARQQRWIPGWVIRDRPGDAVRGWAFAVDRAGADGPERQVGALVADGVDTTGVLIDAILAPPRPPVVHVFTRTDSGTTCDDWCAAGFQVQPYRYMVMPLNPAPEVPASTHAWQEWTPVLGLEAAQLLQRAYAGETTIRPFAPGGRLAEWVEYLDGLTVGPGCGTLIPEASGVVRVNGVVVAMALTTRIGSHMVHLAQLAVDPAAQRMGLARALVSHVVQRAASATGARHISLLVSSGNAAALALYERLGFQPRGMFLAARRA